MSKPLVVFFRIDFSGLCSIGRGKVELLEHIARTGSLSQAARDMDMSYRRAWLLLNSMNTSFNEPVASTTTGGHRGGGVLLTPFGQQLITTYRGLQEELTTLAAQHMRGIIPKVRTNRASKNPVAARKQKMRTKTPPSSGKDSAQKTKKAKS